jgi:WD40 repeat protein
MNAWRLNIQLAIVVLWFVATCAQGRAVQPKSQREEVIRLDVGDSNHVRVAGFAGDDQYLVATLTENYDDHSVRLWEIATGRVERTLEAKRVVAISPCGALIATRNANRDSVVDVWSDLLTKQVVHNAGSGNIRHVAISPNLKMVAIAREYCSVIVLETEKQSVLFEVLAPSLVGQHQVDFLVFSPDSKMMATCNAQKVRIWDTATGKELATVPKKYSAEVAAFSPDSTTVFFAGNRKVNSYNVSTGELKGIELENATPDTFSFCENGKVLACSIPSVESFEDVLLVEAGSLNRLPPLTVDGAPRSTDSTSFFNVTRLAFSPSGRFVATTDNKRTLRLYASEGELQFLKQVLGEKETHTHQNRMSDLRFSRNDYLAVTYSGGKGVVVYPPAMLTRLADAANAALAEQKKRAADEAERAKADSVRQAAAAMERNRAAAETKAKAEERQHKTMAMLSPAWGQDEDLTAIVNAFQSESLSLEDYVLYGTIENAKKARVGDRFDAEDALEAGRAHQRELAEKSLNWQCRYSWPQLDTDEAGYVTVEAKFPFRLDVAKHATGRADSLDQQQQSDVYAADYDNKHFVLLKPGRLEACVEHQVDELRRRGAVLYVSESAAGGRLRMRIRAERDVLKQVARGGDDCVLNVRVSSLRVKERRGTTYFRIDTLAKDGGSTEYAHFASPELTEAPPVYRSDEAGEGAVTIVTATLEELEIVDAGGDERRVLFHWHAASKE